MTQPNTELEFRMVVKRTELVSDGVARVHLSEYGHNTKADLDVTISGNENLARFVVGELFALRLIPHERQR